ncbi:BacD [Geobacter metallireducens RCH3]|uniref:hypothetical protein n=1 Tax=Geobacter metallireducens TaxID=28232 RepID=UPI00024A51BA|nr:hypothetical protein [Geobacter metallireducens]EHP84657.1 BacD [Geobacter metallireducens RCH3]
MKTSPKHNFHLPFPAVEEWVRPQRVNAVNEELVSYAQAHAGTAADLDEALEGAASEHLRGSRKGP